MSGRLFSERDSALESVSEVRMRSARAAGPSPRDYDLLGGGSDAIDLAMLAARSSAAARRAASLGPIDDIDRHSLDALAELLERSATAIEYFGTAGQAGTRPSGALAARVDVAIDVVLHEMTGPADTPELAAKLRSWASDVRGVTGQPDAASARDVADFLTVLASSVLRVTGHPGEVAHRL